VLALQKAIGDLLTEDEKFQELDASFYPQHIPSAPSYPYVSCDNPMNYSKRTTVGRVWHGETVTWPFLVYSDDSGEVEELMDVVEDLFSFQEFDVSGWTVQSCRRTNKTHIEPIEDEQDRRVWGGFLQYEIILRREE